MRKHTIANPYDTLGVSKTATQEEIKAKYKELAMLHHPDKGGTDEKMKNINQAYDILSSPEKRLAYDSPQNTFRASQNPWADMNMDAFINQAFGGNNSFFHFNFGNTNPNVRVNMETVVNQEANISCIDLMLGTTLDVTTPSGEKKRILIPAGTQNGTTFRITDRHLGATLHIHLRINAVIPMLTNEQIERLKTVLNIKAETPA